LSVGIFLMGRRSRKTCDFVLSPIIHLCFNCSQKMAEKPKVFDI